jgi:hypothetical protein
VQKWFSDFVTALKDTRAVAEPVRVAPAKGAAALAYLPERPAVGLP